jgi:hypothetical protein
MQCIGRRQWIDDMDVSSRRIFTFPMPISCLAETGQPAAAPVVTVPSRQAMQIDGEARHCRHRGATP